MYYSIPKLFIKILSIGDQLINPGKKTEHEELARLEAEARILRDLLVRAGEYTSELEAELQSAGEEKRRLRDLLRERKEILEAVYASRSWKITLPVRILSGLARSLLSRFSGRPSTPGRQEPGSPVNTPAAAGIAGSMQNPTWNESTQKAPKQRGKKHLSPRETEICRELTRLVKEKKNRECGS